MANKIDKKAKSIQNKIKQGKGQGEGKDYEAFLTVRDVPSRGLSSRPPDNNHGHSETLSRLETGYIAHAALYDYIEGVREQYYLPLEDTVKIAESWHIDHPTVPSTKRGEKPALFPLTTDCVITVVKGTERIILARAIKMASELANRRTIEKLTIECIFWRTRHVDWGIVTNREITRTFIKNCTFLRNRITLDDLSLTQNDIDDATTYLISMAKMGSTPLNEIALQCDAKLGLTSGSSLAVAYHLMARGIWKIDLYQPIDTGKIVRMQ